MNFDSRTPEQLRAAVAEAQEFEPTESQIQEFVGFTSNLDAVSGTKSLEDSAFLTELTMRIIMKHPILMLDPDAAHMLVRIGIGWVYWKEQQKKNSQVGTNMAD